MESPGKYQETDTTYIKKTTVEESIAKVFAISLTKVWFSYLRIILTTEKN